MKKILIGLLALGSISAMSETTCRGSLMSLNDTINFEATILDNEVAELVVLGHDSLKLDTTLPEKVTLTYSNVIDSKDISFYNKTFRYKGRNYFGVELFNISCKSRI